MFESVTRRLGRATIVAALAVLVVLAAPAASAATQSAPLQVRPASTATVSGLVKDSKGNALGGWTVWFVPGFNVNLAQSTVADSSGNYSIALTPGSSWSTAMTAPGSSLTGSIADGAEAGIGFLQVDSSMSLDFTLPVVAVTVTVLDGSAPLAGATITTNAMQGASLASPVNPGASINMGWRSAQSATTDASGQATLDLLALAAPLSANVGVTPPSPSPLQPRTLTLGDLTTDSTHTVNLAPAGSTATVSGVARTSKGDVLGTFWSVAFMPAGQPDQATIVTTAADGSYTAQVPESDDTVELFDGAAPDSSGQDFVRAGGLALTGPTTLDLTQPVVDLHVHVADSEGRPVVRADMFTASVGTTASPAPTGHLFAGSTGDVGAQIGEDGATDASGDATIEVLQSTTASSIFGYYPAGPYVDPGPVPFTPSADQTLTITLQVCVVLPGVGSVAAPTSGTSQLTIPVTLSVPSDNYVYVPWRTAVIPNALPGQAPQADYVAASGTLVFLPGQTTPITPITITVTANATGGDEYLAVGFHDVVNAEVGGNPLHLAYGFIDAAEPTIRPGLGTAPAPVSGAAELDVPVTLSAPSAATVTVHWTTLSLTGDSLAPDGDYDAASGTVTFVPGETEATVPITVTGNSTGQPEYVVVSFSAPTDAQLGGFWGLGFGRIDPPA